MNPVDACHDHAHGGFGAKTRAMSHVFILPFCRFCRFCRFNGGHRHLHRLPLEVLLSMFITPHPQNGTNGKNGKTAGVERGVVAGRGTGPGAGDAGRRVSLFCLTRAVQRPILKPISNRSQYRPS
jgi:hypothetical protein